MRIPPDIQNEYALLRQKAQREAENRRREVFEREPRIEALEDEIRRVAFEYGIRLRNSNDAAELKLETESTIVKLNEAECDALEALGYPRDFFAPRYRCAECGDTGFVDAAKTKMCACLENRLLKRRYELSYVDGAARFENFDISLFTDGAVRKRMEKIRAFLERYADDFPGNEVRNLLLMGNTGLGKTFMLSCVAGRLMERGKSAVRITSYNLITTVLNKMRANEELPTFTEPDFLIIDDLGTEPLIPNVTVSQLFAVLNERIDMRRPTGIATNLSPADLSERYGERIVSRLLSPMSFSVIHLEGGDLRRRKKAD